MDDRPSIIGGKGSDLESGTTGHARGDLDDSVSHALSACVFYKPLQINK